LIESIDGTHSFSYKNENGQLREEGENEIGTKCLVFCRKMSKALDKIEEFD
jgi:hypothetical protein